jgi:membrane associated rhomboid family serine protease
MKAKIEIKYEALIIPILVLILMWVVYWGEFVSSIDLTRLGILPRTIKGLFGILFSPLLHSKTDLNHIINNSIPIYFSLVALFFFYQKIAYKTFFLSWIISGILTWLIAENEGSYHIGMSSVIYSLIVFLFVSGIIKKKLKYQAISLLIVISYGSLVWGIFPVEEKVSWQGHLSGVISGVLLALLFVEKELEPIRENPSFIPNQSIEEQLQKIKNTHSKNQQFSNQNITIEYTYIKK